MAEEKNVKNEMLKDVDWPVFITSGGFLVVFVIAALISIDSVSAFVNTTFDWSATYFGAIFQALCFLTVVIAFGLAISKYGSVKLGGNVKPEIGTFSWVCMIMMTLLAGGGIFWSAAEPIYHFTDVPPFFSGIEAGSAEAVEPALSASFLHWGFNAWAILATLTTVVLMYAYHVKGLPLKPRSMLYPVLGEKGVMGPWGSVADIVAIVAVAAGTIGPIGFLGLQMSYMLEHTLGVPNVFLTQLGILVVLVGIYTLSAVTGLYKGIRFLSRFNVIAAFVLVGLVLLVGPAGFIIDSFLGSFGSHVRDFVPMTLYRGDGGWLSWWTVFFFAWFLGYGPMMGLFVARISKGRTIRELVTGVGIIAPIATMFWFTTLGGSGIFFELNNPGIISEPLFDAGLPAALLHIALELPLSMIIVPLIMVLLVSFLATTGDSMAFTMSIVVSGKENPYAPIRIFWAIIMGAVAAILIMIGEGGIEALQNFIVFTAVPVSLLLIPMLWGGPILAKRMHKMQFPHMYKPEELEEDDKAEPTTEASPGSENA
ncbi:BCCT family transporter [Natranaerofaba carboxydovora]|uniref:BCCT family transporter n=1 Tax=Natranaerofaba carboxydovora TaxID=2742683 RepID=UPI001F148997|nr:BCCT family transporter [Natranaerofaba carboxydovora]UMZ74789.1 Glycine betaine transporter OpuD [Natranaerofaba carboxydovora]